MPVVVCKRCGESRTLARVRKYTDCRDCSTELKKQQKTTYLRICDTCGNEKEYKYKPLVTKCLPCANKIRKDVATEGCRRICIDCKKVDYLSNPYSVAKAKRCRSCSAKHRTKTTPMPKHEGDGLRHFRLCPECGDCKQVALSGAGTKLCRTCSNRKIAKNRPPKPKKEKKKRKKTYTPIGIDGQQKVTIKEPKVKYQVVDIETMEAPVKKRKKEELPQLDENESRRMQEEFLNRRKSNGS